MVQNWETKPVHSAQCRHVVVCTHQIRRKRTWESLLKTIFDWESEPYQVSKINHTLSTLPIKLHLLVCQVCCCSGARIIMLQCVLFFHGLSCTKLCSNACFFSRFVVHQIVLQCVLFLAVCRAPNRLLLYGSWPGVSFGKLLLVVSLQCLQSSVFHEGIDYW